VIIGMLGLAGSGKSTVGRILRDDYGFVPVSFAETLKDGLSALFNFPRHLLEGDTADSREFRETVDPYWSEILGKDVTPRYLMQYLGTEVMREKFVDTFWIAALGAKMQDKSKSYVITDARFPNEFEWIRNQGGFLVEVVNSYSKPNWVKAAELAYKQRDSVDTIGPVIIAPFKVHQSEWAHVVWRFTNSVDYVLSNDFTAASASYDSLRANAIHMIRVFTGPKDEKTVKNTKVSNETF
jgi:hypothetical protein